MNFSTGITAYNTTYNLNAIDDYNKFLNDNSSFKFDDSTHTDFEIALENAAKSYPIKEIKAPQGIASFASQVGTALNDSLNAVNNIKLEANRMQEDIAMGGSTNIHDAMIAAEKAELSMQMAVQVRNRILSAYTEITGMAI